RSGPDANADAVDKGEPGERRPEAPHAPPATPVDRAASIRVRRRMTATPLRCTRLIRGGKLSKHAPELDVGPRGVGLVDALVELLEVQPAGGEMPPQRGHDGVPLGVG